MWSQCTLPLSDDGSSRSSAGPLIRAWQLSSGVPDTAVWFTEIRYVDQQSRRPRLTTAGDSQGAPTLYTTEEAAEILRVKKSWLERQAAARKIPFTMLGGGYRFTTVHLSAIIRMHEQTPAPSARTGDSDTRSRRLSAGPRVTDRGSPPLRPRPRNGPRRAA
jgi:excisionase family DNA binding protein